MNSLDKMEDYDRLLEKNAELERKLAEQQAEYKSQHPVGYVREYGIECLQGTLVNSVTGRTPPPSRTGIDPSAQADSDIPLYTKLMAASNIEELNNLLAKEREEGRREAVPEGCQVVSKELLDADVDRMLRARIPGGSEAGHWFLPHEHDKGLRNVRDVVRYMLSAAPKPEGTPE